MESDFIKCVVYGSGGAAKCGCPICGFLCNISTLSKEEHSCCHYRLIEVSGSKFTFHFQYKNKTMFHFANLQEKLLRLTSLKMKNDFAKKLNSRDPRMVHSTEWEIVLIDWLNELGTVLYEVKQDNGKCPDLDFVSKELSIRFVADIAAVSDDTLECVYPAGEFIHQIGVILKRITNGDYSFDVRLESAEKGNLAMFAPARIPAILQNFEKWAKGERQTFEIGNCITYTAEENKIQVMVRKKDNYSGGSYPARIYESNLPRNNPVYNILDSKSRRQLCSEENKLVGIFLCDGGCRILSSVQTGWNEVKLKDIIDLALSEHKHIDFVTVFSMRSAFTANQRPQINVDFFLNIAASQEKKDMFLHLHRILVSSLGALAIPVLYPYQSKQEIRRKITESCYWRFCSTAAEIHKHNNA